MPFTVNVGPYKGGDYLFQGLSNLGTGIGGGIEKATAEYKKTQEEQGADQILLNFYQNQGLVTPDVINDYTKGSHSAKTGIIAGLSRQFAQQQTQQQQQSLDAERRSEAALRQAQMGVIKTKQENAILAGQEPTQEQRTRAQQSGYDYIMDPQTQTWSLMPMQGDSGSGKTSDKVPMTLQTPDGPKQVLVTGNKYAAMMTNPVDFKKTYGVTQTEFSDPTKTQTGTVDPTTGEFTPGEGGDWIRYNIHKDRTTGVEMDSGHIPVTEWSNIKNRIATASKPTSATPSGDGAATPTPAPAAPAVGRVRVADKNGKVFTVPASQLDQAIAQGYKKL